MPGTQNSKSTLDFLGTIGSTDDIIFKNSGNALAEMAEFLISEAQINLNKDGTNATGDLESSLYIENFQIDGNKMSLDVMILDRYRFINDGVRGVKGGTGKYAFKNLHPSKDMIENIKKWIRVRGRRVIKYKAINKTERKDKGVAKVRKGFDTTTAAAYAIAVAVKKKGIKPTKFFTKAVAATEKKFRDKIKEGFKLDIIESLK